MVISGGNSKNKREIIHITMVNASAGQYLKELVLVCYIALCEKWLHHILFQSILRKQSKRFTNIL